MELSLDGRGLATPEPKVTPGVGATRALRLYCVRRGLPTFDAMTAPARPAGGPSPWRRSRASRSVCTRRSSCSSRCSCWPGAAPNGPGVANSLVWLVAIFACVVFHELAHCLVGRRHGLVVHEIDLLPIGGVSRLETFPETATRRVLDGHRRPGRKLALALGAAAAARRLSVSLYPVDLVTGPFLARLAWLNLLLAAFNMIPAFPLDGGRVLPFPPRTAVRPRAVDAHRRRHRPMVRVRADRGGHVHELLARHHRRVHLCRRQRRGAGDPGARATRRSPRARRDARACPPPSTRPSAAAELRQLVRRNGQGGLPGGARRAATSASSTSASIERAPDAARAGDLADRSASTLAPDDDLEGDVPASPRHLGTRSRSSTADGSSGSSGSTRSVGSSQRPVPVVQPSERSDGPDSRSSRVANTAAWVRRSMPSFASRFDT